MRRGAWLLAAALCALSCGHKKTDDGTTPAGAEALPKLTIKDDTPDLMLTWIDQKGSTHVELRPADVPTEGRSLVRVVISDREDGTRDLFYVVDLNKKGDDGAYHPETMRRRAWEAEIEKRRESSLPAPRPAGSASGRPAAGEERGRAQVIIYGASWCRPCHEAADYLKSRGVAYVLKDIEETPGAAAEMREKLARAGRHGGSIPVIDVRGQILVGFSPSAIDHALSGAPAGTAL
jgi:glutaredoxin